MMSRRAKDTSAKPNVYSSGLLILVVIVILYSQVEKTACVKDELNFTTRECLSLKNLVLLS